MASFPHHSYGQTLDDYQDQGCVWDSSADMQRSVSQSTAYTLDTNYTANHSNYSSATDYSAIDPSLVADGTWQEASSRPDPYSPRDPPDLDHELSATGSQYQQTGHGLPQTLHLPGPAQLFDTSEAGVKDAAWQATCAAERIIINGQSYPDGGPFFVSSNAVESALHRRQSEGEEEPVRPAVQEILAQELGRLLSVAEPLHDNVVRVLEEAAYQLQTRLQGPEVPEICFYAIVTTLIRVTGDLGIHAGDKASGGPVGMPDSPATRIQKQGDKERFRCRYPGCSHGASRQADLDRHFRIKHVDDNDKIKFFCDYKKCPRHTNPFFRQDHFRDHLRDYHKEDLPRRGNRGDEDWWSSRAPHALYRGWWRCSRCLLRVDQDKNGFLCPRCENRCEKERQQHREAAGQQPRYPAFAASSSSQRRG